MPRKIGDVIKTRLPGTPWDKLLATVEKIETRKSTKTQRYMVMTERGRELYLDEAQMLDV